MALKKGPKPRPIRERFWSKVHKGGGEGCWVWTGKSVQDGYGNLKIGSRSDGTRRTVLAHRWAYETLIGTVPEGLQLDHLCRNRRCVNPRHLRTVTMRENILCGTSIPAQNLRKTHCINGHPFDLFNTYRSPDGRRQCKQCQRNRVTRYKERKRLCLLVSTP